MKKSEKDQLISQLKEKITDWQTPWNQGKVQGINEAIQLVEGMPLDPEETTEEHF